MDDLNGDMHLGMGLEEMLWIVGMLLQVEMYSTSRRRKNRGRDLGAQEQVRRAGAHVG